MKNEIILVKKRHCIISYPAYLLKVRCEPETCSCIENFCSDSQLRAGTKGKRKLLELPSIGRIGINLANTYTEQRAPNWHSISVMQKLRWIGYGNAHTYTQSQHQQLCRVPFHHFFFVDLLFSFHYYTNRVNWWREKFTYFTFQWKVGNFSMGIK